jgi:hypothetical protein
MAAPLDFSKQPPDYEVLADSIYRQEGSDKTKHAYGVMSIKPKDKSDARQIAINTARNNYKRWNDAGQPGAYLDFLASRYVPESADPTGNKNWRANIGKIYTQLSAKKQPEQAAPAAAPAPVLDPLLLKPLPPVQYPMFPVYPLVKR